MASSYPIPLSVNTPPALRLIRDETAPPYDGQAPSERIRLTVIEKDVAVAVCRDCGVTASMYFLLETYANAAGECTPSYDTLAEGLGVSRRQAIRMVAQLEAAGYVAIERRQTKTRGHISNRFVLPHHYKKNTESISGHPSDNPSDSGALASDNPSDNPSAPESPKVVVSSREVVGSNKGDTPLDPPLATSPARTRASVIPEDFTVTDGMREQAAGYGLAPERIDFETDKFRDHFKGSGGKKLDWVAAWRNWMRRASEERPRGARPAAVQPWRGRPDYDGQPNLTNDDLDAIIAGVR